MMIDDRASRLAAGIAILGLALLACVLAGNPENLPESWIQRWVETKLPLGSSIVAVRQTIERERWKTVNETLFGENSTVVVEIGDTWLAREHVFVWFSFDRFGRLGVIRVTKGRERPVRKFVPLD